MSKRLKAIEEDGDESLYNKKLKINGSDSDDDADDGGIGDHKTNDLGSSGSDGERSKQLQCIENNLSTSIVGKIDNDGPCLLSIISQIAKEGSDSKTDAYKESVVGEEEKQQEAYGSDRPNLLNLSDDVLLIILKCLHPFDLLNVSRTCLRLNSVCRDRTLWIDVDFRHDISDKNYMKTTVDFDNFLEFLLPNTRSIKKSGSTRLEFTEFACTSNKTTQVSITPSFILDITSKVSCLKTFALENHTIYGPTITLDCFPSTLEYLSLKNSLVIRLPTDKSYFVKIDKVLPNLRILDLSGCQWFHAHSFLALSKSKTLKELHLKGCLGIEDCVPYASLAATFGFPSLELLDLRSTHVSDSDISCFNRVEKLKKLYLEALDWPGGENKISDIGVASFGSERDLLNANPVGLSFVLIRNQRPGQSALETLVLRNYRSVTDISLKHAASCLPNLKYLDVRGTSCTQNGVSDFKRCRPDVELLTDFNNNLLLESTS